jgi:hypothetical protein
MGSASADSVTTLLPKVNFYNQDLTTNTDVRRTITYTLMRGTESSSINHFVQLLRPATPLPSHSGFTYTSHDPAVIIDSGVTVPAAYPSEITIIRATIEKYGVNDQINIRPTAPLSSDESGTLFYSGSPIALYTRDPDKKWFSAQLLPNVSKEMMRSIFASFTFYNASNNSTLHIIKSDIRYVHFQIASSVPELPPMQAIYSITVDHNPLNSKPLEVPGLKILSLRSLIEQTSSSS